jgi:hypothetical protein
MATQRQLEFLERRVDGMSARADALLERQLREREAEQARADADLETARRQKARAYSEGCRQIAARYDDAFSSFNVSTPQAIDGEHPEKFRIRLFNRLARKLPQGHAWGDTRADDLPLGPAMDKIEQLILEAAKLEGENPSIENLPEDGTIIERTRLDDTGMRSTKFYGKRSYIADMGRPGRKVLRICDPKSGRVLLGAQFPRAD